MGDGTWTPGTVTLAWPEGHYLCGLELVMRRRSVADLLAIWREAADEGSVPDDRPALVKRADNFEETVALLAPLIVSWTGPGEPTVDTLLATFGPEDIDDVWSAYNDATSRVSRPLPSSSGDGQPSEAPEFDLPTVPLPDSPPS